MPPIFFYLLYAAALGSISIHVRYKSGKEINLTGWAGFVVDYIVRRWGKR